MKLLLIRERFMADRTLGQLYTPDGYFCDTLEPHRIDWEKEKKVRGKTAIPEGKYKVELAWSTKWGRVVPWLKSVPHFTGIQIHIGNTPKDTAGCILVGDAEKNIVVNSTFCFMQLMKRLKEAKDGIEITIAHCNDRDRAMKEMYPHYKPDATGDELDESEFEEEECDERILEKFL